MPYTITASVNTTLPGSIKVSVIGNANVVSSIVRLDGSQVGQPVRNWTTTGSGVEQVIDCEAPLGRQVWYQLLDANGAPLAVTAAITCPPLPSGKSLLRSVLRPSVAWMEVEVADETGVEWATSTTPFPVVGSDTPVVVGEVRQRHSGVLVLLCRSIEEADGVVRLARDGTALLIRHDPCAAVQVRDMLFFALGVSEERVSRDGARIVAIDFQSSKFIAGETEEPGTGWDFAALGASAPNFGVLAGRYQDFASMALDLRKP